ncbi:MAG TPA: M50 family peptidase [Chloroflexi bacterium]|nr:M50 family peptidase [Chloroflexota bacterium]
MAGASPSKAKGHSDVFSLAQERLTATEGGAAPGALWELAEERLAREPQGGPSLWESLAQSLRLIKARPRLRGDLVVSRVEEGGKVYFVIKDPVALKYFRFKENEYFVLTLLDGHHEVRDLVREYSLRYRPIRPETVQRFLERVESFGLLEKGRGNLYARLLSRLFSGWTSRLARLLRFDYTVPDTDAFTQRLYRKVRFLFSPPAAWCWVMLALSGLIPVLASWGEFKDTLAAIAASGWGIASYALLFYVSMAVVIVVHELAHALTCVHFGGHVHKMGVMFYYLSLAAYADTSDAWLFPNRWHRAWVSLAGPLSTLAFGSLSAWAWWLAPTGSDLSRLAVMLTLSTVPLSFSNLNPFMEYDGYYVLSDLTGIVNLRHRSFDYCRRWLRHILLGGEAPPHVEPYQKRVFLGYGLLAAAYFVGLVMLPLFWQISYLLNRFGLAAGGALAALTLALFVRRPVKTLYARWRDKIFGGDRKWLSRKTP